MPSRTSESPSTSLSFEAWKSQLRKDCELNDKVDAFNALGDYVLKLLWEQCAEPTCDAISHLTD